MPLTKEQRAKLFEELGPVINDAIKEGARPVIQEELKRITAESRDESESYTARILSNRDRETLRNLERDPKKAGVGVARIARCVALANNDVEHAARIAQASYDDDLGTAVHKVLSSGVADEGGVFVPEEMSDAFIDALRARAVVRGAGAAMGWVEIDLTGGNLRVPRITTDPTAGYVGENAARNASDMATGDLNFVAKTLQGKTSVTQQLLRRSGQNAETIMRDNLVKVMANEEDSVLLNGLGTASAPRGMRGWVPAANSFNVNGTVNLSNVQADLRTAMGNLEDNDVLLDNAAWFMRPRERTFLAHELRDQDDKPVFKGELTADTPMLNGLRAFFTNNIPANLDASGNGSDDESRIYLTAMDHAWFAEEGGLRIRATNEASFTDSTGTLISAFDRGLMAIIIEREHDFAMSHGEAVSMMEAVDWGA